MAAPGIPAALRMGVYDLLLGTAEAQTLEAPPTFFYENNSRDQNYWIQVAMAPGLATNTNLQRGETGKKCSFFFQQSELTKTSRGFVPICGPTTPSCSMCSTIRAARLYPILSRRWTYEIDELRVCATIATA